MIKTLLNPNHVLTDCDNIENIDAQRMAAVLGKHLYGFKKGDERAVVKTLGLDANNDVCWSNTGVPGGGLPPSTPEDEGKVLVVGDDGQPEWADLPGGDIAYSVDRATQASWDVDTLYASTQFYIADSGDNGGIEYYLDGQDRKAGYELLEGHVYQVNFNCEATCASTSNNVWEGSIYVTGAQDQNWYFQLDGSQSIDVSLTGSTIIHCSSDSVLYFNARLNGSYTGSLPTLTMNKVSIVDLTSAIGGSGGGSVPRYRPGEGIEIEDGVISIDPTETQEKLTAGTNVSINSNNVISATDTTYTAGTNVSIDSNNVISATDTTYNVFNTSTDGLVPKANGTGDTGKFLRGDHTWQYPATGSDGDANHPNYITQDANGQLHYLRAPRLFWDFTYNNPSIELTATDISNGYAEFVFVLGTEGLAIAETGNIIGIKGYDISMGNSLNGKQMSFYLVNHGGGSPRMLMDTGFQTFTESVVNNYDWKAFKAIGLTANRNVSKLDAVLRVPLSTSATAGDTLSIPGHVTVTIFGIATNDAPVV